MAAKTTTDTSPLRFTLCKEVCALDIASVCERVKFTSITKVFM